MPAVATIDHHTLARLVQDSAVHATHVVATPGGWAVIVQYDGIESALAATRSKQIRVFKRLETLIGYLKGVGISRFDVDANYFDTAAAKPPSRPDNSASLKQAHAALAHDRWFRDKVEQALKEADDLAAQWVSNETAMAEAAKRRAVWRTKGASMKAARGAD